MYQNEVRAFLERTNGKIFSATFVKKDLSLRRMTARLGVKKGVKGITNRKQEDEKYDLITVYDFNANRIDNKNKGGFRRINLKTLIKICSRGETFQIEK